MQPTKINPKYNPITNRSAIFEPSENIHPPTYQTYPYIPMINIPTTSKLPSPGEIVTSVELLTKHVSNLSRKIDRIESRVNDWVNLQLAERMQIAERGITALKTCHNDHDAKIANISQHYMTEKDGTDLYERIRELLDQNDDVNKCLDRFSDILTTHKRKLRHAKHRSRNLAKKYAEIGILRRRVSKVEENNTENAQCFETNTEIRGLLDDMRVELREYKDKCAYLESANACLHFSSNSHSHIEDLYHDLPSLEPIMCHENMELCEGTDLDAYFSNYLDTMDTMDTAITAENKPEENNENKVYKEIVIDLDEEYAKNPGLYEDDDDDEFEKL